MLSKAIMLLVSIFLSLSIQASPAQQEQIQRCQTEAALTQFGFSARFNMDKEEFLAQLEKFKAEAAKDPNVPAGAVDKAVKALKQGFAGLSPQKAFDACMSQKTVRN